MEHTIDFTNAQLTAETLSSVSCPSLRDQLNGLYDQAFARAPSPAKFARLMAQAKVVHDELAKTDDNLSCFTTDIHEHTRMDLRKVQRLVERGMKVLPEVLDAVERNPSMDKGVVLKRLANTPKAEQMGTFQALMADRAQPKVTTDEDRANNFLNQFDKLPKAIQRVVLAGLADKRAKGAL